MTIYERYDINVSFWLHKQTAHNKDEAIESIRYVLAETFGEGIEFEIGAARVITSGEGMMKN